MFIKFYIMLFFKSFGKFLLKDIYLDSIVFFWEKVDENVDYYQLWMKVKIENLRWKFIEIRFNENLLIVLGLMVNIKYVFKVYCVFKDGEG